MPPPTATASVAIQYHSRRRASTTPNPTVATLIGSVECKLVTAMKNAVAPGMACSCSQVAMRPSSATSLERVSTFQAIARKTSPATRNAPQPATASATGERLGGCRPALLLFGGFLRLAVSLACLALRLALAFLRFALDLALGLLRRRLGLRLGARVARGLGGRGQRGEPEAGGDQQ